MKIFSKNIRILTIILIVIGVFLIDLSLPLGYSFWELYLITFLFAYPVFENKYLYLLSALCSGLIIIDLFLSESGLPFEISILNRVLFIILLFTFSAGIIEIKKRSRDTFNKKEELNKTHQELKVKEAKLLAVIENTSDAIWSVDKRYRFTLANSLTSERMKKYLDRELKIGDSALWEIVSESMAERWKKWYDRALSGESFMIEDTVEIKPNVILYREYSLNPIYENEEITGVVCFSRDISERKQFENQIKQDNILLNGILNSSTDGTSVFKSIRDENGKIIDFEWLLINSAGAEIIGKDKGEIINQKMLDLLPGTKQEGLFDSYVKIVENDLIEDREHYYKHEGIDSWFREIALKYEDGFIVSFQDITKRKQAECELRKLLSQLEEIVELRTQELKDTNKKLQLYIAEVEDLYENAPCGYHSLDEYGTIIMINSTELEWLGYTKEELVNKKKITDVMTESSIEEFKKHFPEFKRTGELHNHEFEMLRKDGSIMPTLLSSSALKDEAGKFIRSRSTLIDITEIKKAEKEIRDLNKDLQRNHILFESINKELESFSYSVSHDLRAPLRHIQGFIELLKLSMEAKLNEKEQHYIDVISKSSDEMGVLIDELLQFSRLGRTEMEFKKLNLEEIVKKEIEKINSEYKDRNIQFNIPSTLPEVYGDKTSLHSVFSNLISNAVKYSSKKSEIKIHIGYEKNQDEYIFHIKDNGAGFDMKYADKLFGVFQRLHSAKDFDGIGIGLANVRRIISKHGGKTWAEGEIDKGATFYFSLQIK